MAIDRTKIDPKTLDELAQNALKNVQKRFGTGAAMFGDNYKVDVNAISTGSLGLDIAIGIGGLPVGRVVEIYGPEGSGKTTVCLSTIAQAQARGELCAFVDMEHALDPVWAKKLGVNTDKLMISQPDTAEDALSITEEFITSGAFSIVVVDSVAALVPRAEIEGEFGDSHMGLQARLMSQALRKLVGIVKSQDTILIFTNQLRDKIGIVYGSPEVTSGGKALKFYASVRMDVRKKEVIKENGKIVGSYHKVKIKKNKVAAPFREATLEIRYETGLSLISDIVSQAIESEVIARSGAWYKYLRNDEEVFKLNGVAKVKAYLEKDLDLTFEIHNLILEQHGMDQLTEMPRYVEKVDVDENVTEDSLELG